MLYASLLQLATVSGGLPLKKAFLSALPYKNVCLVLWPQHTAGTAGRGRL
jgi:hypothetical protein